MKPHQLLERIFGGLPKEGCIIQVQPPEPSGRIPFTVYDMTREEKDGSPWVHRCGVTPAELSRTEFGAMIVGPRHFPGFKPTDGTNGAGGVFG
jgi:hypothetical protein